jgi:hypothetical protein
MTTDKAVLACWEALTSNASSYTWWTVSHPTTGPANGRQAHYHAMACPDDTGWSWGISELKSRAEDLQINQPILAAGHENSEQEAFDAADAAIEELLSEARSR